MIKKLKNTVKNLVGTRNRSMQLNYNCDTAAKHLLKRKLWQCMSVSKKEGILAKNEKHVQYSITNIPKSFMKSSQPSSKRKTFNDFLQQVLTIMHL